MLEGIQKSLAGRAERGEILAYNGSPVIGGGGGLWADFETTLRQLTVARPTLLLTLLARALPFLAPSLHLSVQGAPAESFGGRPAPLKEAIDTWTTNGARVILISAQAPRLRGFGIQESAQVKLIDGLITAGFRLPEANLVVLSDTELFGDRHRFKKQAKRREFTKPVAMTKLSDLQPGATIEISPEELARIIEQVIA